MIQETGKIRKRGAFVIPTSLRRRFGLEDGSLVIAEECEDGVLIRPAVALPIERYTPVREAQRTFRLFRIHGILRVEIAVQGEDHGGSTQSV